MQYKTYTAHGEGGGGGGGNDCDLFSGTQFTHCGPTVEMRTCDGALCHFSFISLGVIVPGTHTHKIIYENYFFVVQMDFI